MTSYRWESIPTDHPAYPPDLNPIEHVWCYLKEALHYKLASFHGGLEAVEKRIAECLGGRFLLLC